MADFVPPAGPPPPKVPEGWVARWNDQYKEWFYVNLITKQSQWDKPTEPARAADDTAGPEGAPPSYLADPNRPALTDSKKSHLESNNPYNQHTGSPGIDEEAKLAAQLQAEEDARARSSGGNRGAGQDYYNQGGQQYQDQSGQYPQNLPPRPDESSRSGGGGFLGKLLKKGKGHSSGPGYGSPQPGYGGQGGYGGQQQYYPPQQQGYYPQQQPGYGGYGGYGPGGYPPPGVIQQQPPRKSGGGLGAGGAAALGLGGGLLGGALLAESFDGGGDGGGGDDGDYGGGDDGGGGGGDF